MWAFVGLVALLPFAVLALAGRRLGRWPAAALALLFLAVEADVLRDTVSSSNAFEPVVAVSTLVALLALTPLSVALVEALRLLARRLRGDALPPAGWRDAAIGAALGVAGFVVLSVVGAAVGVSIAFALWAGREPAPAAEM